VISAVAGGIARIAGGAIAQWFASTHLAVVVRWTSADNRNELLVASFAHWEFLFGISAVLGLYAIHAVARVGEAGEHTERLVIQELALEALRTVNHLSSVGGVLGGSLPSNACRDRCCRAARANAGAIGSSNCCGLHRSVAAGAHAPRPLHSLEPRARAGMHLALAPSCRKAQRRLTARVEQHE
jgi:hypothetical protein